MINRKNLNQPAGEYKSGDYRLKITEQSTGRQTCVITFELTRSTSHSFKVPAFSVNLDEQSDSHKAIMQAWLDFYERNKRDLVLGRMMPLLPTPPSAALRIESGEQAFFGFYEAVPGLIQVVSPVDKITLVNAFDKRTVTRLEGVDLRLSGLFHLFLAG